MSEPARFVLVTGMSGAGKSRTLDFLEDLGYYCVDNLPASLLPTFAELILSSNPPRKLVAVCIDARTSEALPKIPAFLNAVAGLGIRPDVLFLESDESVLLQRYSESRRRHPLAGTRPIAEGIHRERELLQPLRERADLVVDTSETPLSELRERLASMFPPSSSRPGLVVTVMSFGFKNGIPHEADLLFDVRFLPNPYYDPDLRNRTGQEPEVRDYVLDNPVATEFINRVQGLLKFLVPLYAAEPKSYLTVAFGCTGGHHRSVAIAHQVALFLRGLQYDVRQRNRDLPRF